MKLKSPIMLLLYFTTTFHILDAEKFEFTFCTVNILSNFAYNKWSKAPTMDLDQRKKLMQKYFTKGGEFHTDIICLQECNAKPTDNNTEYLYLKKVLQNNGYTVIDPVELNQTKNLGQSTAIAYQTSKFKSANNSYTIQPKVDGKVNTSKMLTSTTIIPKSLKNLPEIKLISLHNPLYGVLDYINSVVSIHSGIKGFTIISGDFNYNIIKNKNPNPPEDYSKLSKLFNSALFNLFTNKQSFLNAKPNQKDSIYYNAAEPLVTNQIPTSDGNINGPELIDYIFYTPNMPPNQGQWKMKCTNFEIYPQDTTQLLRHHLPQNDPNGTNYKQFLQSKAQYFSDHAGLIATFIIYDDPKELKTMTKKPDPRSVERLGAGLNAIKLG